MAYFEKSLQAVATLDSVLTTANETFKTEQKRLLATLKDPTKQIGEMRKALNETEAEQKLGFDYEIISTSKAIIKLESGKEIPTYEFFVERIDGKYFYYINAETNEIAKTMKLVMVDDVEKII